MVSRLALKPSVFFLGSYFNRFLSVHLLWICNQAKVPRGFYVLFC